MPVWSNLDVQTFLLLVLVGLVTTLVNCSQEAWSLSFIIVQFTSVYNSNNVYIIVSPKKHMKLGLRIQTGRIYIIL